MGFPVVAYTDVAAVGSFEREFSDDAALYVRCPGRQAAAVQDFSALSARTGQPKATLSRPASGCNRALRYVCVLSWKVRTPIDKQARAR
jgi:hypothetical protein